MGGVGHFVTFLANMFRVGKNKQEIFNVLRGGLQVKWALLPASERYRTFVAGKSARIN
jgi:hypothetical protein